MPANERIVDASAIAAVLFFEEGYSGVLKSIGQCPMAAPSLLPYELANVSLKKKKNDPARSGAIEGALQGYVDLPIDLFPVAPFGTAQFAELFKLSAYDAAYLNLAVQRNTPLVTLDSNLGKAAKKMGLLA